MSKKFIGLLLSLIILTSVFPQIVFADNNTEIVVGISTPFVPFETEVNGEYVGYDIEVMDYICNQLNLKPKYIDMDFDELMHSLISGEIDCIISAITATETRMQYADFTRPYFVGRFVYPEETIDFFERLSIAFPKGSNYRQRFNDIISKAEKDGILKNIASKYSLVYDDAMNSSKDDAYQYIIQRDDRSIISSDKSGKRLLEYYYDRIILNPSTPELKTVNNLIQEDCDSFFGDDDGSWVLDSPPMYENEVYVNGCQAAVTKNDNNIFSIKIRSDWYAGGVHNAGYYGLNYNLKTGKVLTLSNLFAMPDDELLVYIKECSKKYIDQHPDMYWWDDEYQNAKQIIDEYTISDFEFYIEEDNVCICYPVYELGPGAMGPVIIECPIKNADLSPILKGNFSEFAGTYRYDSGISFELLPNGLSNSNVSDEEIEYCVEDIEKHSDGTYSWSVNDYYYGECMGGAVCILYPKGVEVLSYDGRILPTDTSKVRYWCGQDEVYDVQYIAYKQDEVVIAETISDEVVLKAEILNRNDQFDAHRNYIESPATVLNEALMNNSSQNWASAYMFTYELSKILSLSIPDLEKFDMKSYYEAVLMDILENDNESVWSDFYNVWGNIYSGYNEDIVQKILNQIPDMEKYKDTKLSKETDIEIVLDTIKDTKGELKDIKIDFSLFDTFAFCYDTLTDNLAVIDEIYAYSAITQEKIDVLKAIQNSTDNTELEKACESMIKRYQEVHSEVVAEVAASAARESLIATGKNILELSQSVTVDLFLQVAQTTSAAEIVKSYSTGKMIMTGSRLATDLVINSTDISKNIFVIAAYSDIENEIKQVISSSEATFESNKTYDNAVKYIASADVFKAALLNSCDLYIKFVKDVESGTKGLEIAKGLIICEPKDILKNLWQVNAEYNEKIKQAERIKGMIQTTDFYDTYGTDIVEYISHIVSTTPSTWAQEYVDWAIANNLLPYDYLRGNYQNNITRAEFCTLLTFMIQEFTGKNIEELQGNLPYDPKLFSDSYYDYVYYMASLGIVNGVSETEFNPLGEITREEAAVMLYRAAKVAGCDVSAPATNLNDVSNWATAGVNFVVDRGIMTGTDVGFEPKGTYTKEQAITTFVRFMQNLK